jgi:chromosome segregation ATPase
MTTRDLYLMKLQTKLEDWNTEIDRLQERSQDVRADLRSEYEDQLAMLRAERDKIANRMTNLQQAGDSAFDEVKAGFDKAWRELDESVHRAAQRVKEMT